LPKPVAEVMSLELRSSGDWGLPGLSSSAVSYNEEFIKQHAKRSVSHAVAAACATTEIDPAKANGAADTVLNAELGGNITYKDGVDALNWMKEAKVGSEKVAAFCAKARTRFPLCTAFAEPKSS